MMNENQDVLIHYEYLYGYAIKKVNDHDLAFDLVQDTYLAAFENLDKFQKKSKLVTWLTAILKYKIYKLHRKNSNNPLSYVGDTRHDLTNIGTDERLLLIIPFKPNTDPLEIKEFNEIIQKFLLNLSELWRNVFTKKFLLDETPETICKDLMLSSSYYWVILHRIKSHLRLWLNTYWNLQNY